MGALRVAVVGAGVVGVTSALEVLFRLPTAQVVVIADKFNQDTTSDGAAGIFRPGTSFSGPTPSITRQLLADSYSYYSDLLNTDCGVSRVSGYIFSSTSPSLVRNHLLEGLVPVYRAATAAELSACPGDWKYGSYFETLLTECRYFLPWALDRIKAAGGSVATQVIKVEAPWVKHFYYADYDTYVIPGVGGTVTLGGSRHYDSHSTVACRHDRAAIEERCLALVRRRPDSWAAGRDCGPTETRSDWTPRPSAVLRWFTTTVTEGMELRLRPGLLSTL